MAETLITILTAHLLGNFILQTNWMEEHKRHIGVLLLRAFVVMILTCLLMGSFPWQILLIIFLLNFVVDAIKIYRKMDSLFSFIIIQSVHLIVLTGLAAIFADTATNSWWTTFLKDGLSDWYFASLSLLSGLILAIPVGGVLVGKATKPLMQEIGENDIKGLEKGGLYIGWLERFLVLPLFLINQPTGIGFLFAAKSILRFGEIKDTSQRKVAEYIIIGTFFSFGWALSIAALKQRVIQHWLSP